MKKHSRKPKRQSSPQLRVGHYVFAFRDSDGRLREATDAEMNTLVTQSQIVERDAQQPPGVTINQADELPGGVRLEEAIQSAECRCQSGGPAPCPVHPAPPRAEAKQWVNPPELAAAIQATKERPVEPKDIGAALARSPAYTGPPVSEEEIDRVLAGNGIPPAPDTKAAAAVPAPEPQKTMDNAPAPPQVRRPLDAAAEDGWADAAATLIYKGLCLFTGATLCGAGVILGGWAAVKALPWLEALLSGQSL